MLNLGFSALFGTISTVCLFIVATSLIGDITNLTFTALIMATVSLASLSLLLFWHLVQGK